MCNFFSCIVTRDGKVLFTEEDSHEHVIERSGLKDDLEHFVRVEYTNENGYCVDESTIPEWYERMSAMIERNVELTYRNVKSLYDEYLEIQQPAWDKYHKITQPASDDYETIMQHAWKEYKKIQQSALDKCNNIKQHALDEYITITQPAWAKFLKEISNIEGCISI